MKPSKKSIVPSLLALSILAFALASSAYAGNSASGTVCLGVVLVSTVQAESQQAAQSVAVVMGNGATMRIDSGNLGVSGQVREIDVVISREASKVGSPKIAGSDAQSLQPASATLVQTTYVAD